MNRKLLRDLIAARGLLIAIISIMMLGTGLLVGMQSTFTNMQAAKDRYYRQCRMADFWIDLKKAPLAELEVLQDIPGIRNWRDRIQFPVTVDIEQRIRPLNGTVISLPDQRQPVTNDIVLIRGDYFSDRGEPEVIVNDKFAEANRLHPGQKIHLLLNNRREEFLIVGTAISAEFTYLIGPGSLTPDPENFGVFYLPRRQMEELFDFEGAANQVVGHFTPGIGNDRQAVLDLAERRLESSGFISATLLKDFTSNYFVSNEIDQLSNMATVLPGMFLAVAAAILNVLMTRLARQQRTTIGTLKAIGYSDATIFWHFLKFGAVVGLIAGMLASGIGTLLTWMMLAQYQQFFQFPDLRNGFFLQTHLIGWSVSIVCAVLGSLYGARQMLLLQPAEAMRPEPPAKGGRVLVERITLIWNQLSPGWRVTIRSMIRQRSRTTIALFAGTVGAGILVSGLMMMEATEYFIRDEFERRNRSDIELTFKDALDRQAWYDLSHLPGVDLVEPQFNLACDFVNGPYKRQGAINGILPDAQLTVPTDEAKRRIAIPSVGLVMERRLADHLQLRVGDIVEIRPKSGRRNPLHVPVAAISDSQFGLNVYADMEYLCRIRDESFAMSGAQLKINQADHAQRELYLSLKQMPAMEAINSRLELIKNMRDTIIENQNISIGIIVVFAGTIFFGNVLNASLVNLSERQREVATMGAMGYTRWEIGLLFLRESLVINTIGAVLGIPVGYFLIHLMVQMVDQDLIRFPVVTASWIWISVFATALSFTLLAHAVVQWQIYRMNWLDSLKVRE
ncbi:ABC transporter permease [Bremerella cremea]|uniref:ABC transporter permease n=1 Tax=Bremerella cremea TaxID=1031537 RepID=UPI001314C02F|nr:FtsX-like permease family protein [Bremerella cremea]